MTSIEYDRKSIMEEYFLWDLKEERVSATRNRGVRLQVQSETIDPSNTLYPTSESRGMYALALEGLKRIWMGDVMTHWTNGQLTS